MQEMLTSWCTETLPIFDAQFCFYVQSFLSSVARDFRFEAGARKQQTESRQWKGSSWRVHGRVPVAGKGARKAERGRFWF